jgi:hypothetical protein
VRAEGKAYGSCQEVSSKAGRAKGSITAITIMRPR